MIGRRELMAMVASGALLPGASFAAGGRVFTAKIALEANRVLVGVGMNGQGPYIFMIDTGSYLSMIRPDLAKQLKLPVEAVEHSSGIGGRGSYNLYMAKDFVIGGGVRQANVVLSDAFDFGYRQGIQGALAAGIVTAIDTDLDFDAGELRLYPDGRGARAGYVAIDSTIPRPDPARGSQRIVATVLVEGRPLRCMLDTGSPSHLLINQSAAKRLGLWGGRAYSPSRPRGIGGTGPIARTIRAASLGMGDLKVDRPVVTMLGDDVGGGFDGILGLSFIRRLNLSIDTRAHKLWVKPGAQPPVPERYPMSGLWLEASGDAFVVQAVGPGSPAATAGIEVGDRIRRPAYDLYASLGGSPGDVVRLNVVRGGSAAREVSLTLTPYL